MINHFFNRIICKHGLLYSLLVLATVLVIVHQFSTPQTGAMKTLSRVHSETPHVPQLPTMPTGNASITVDPNTQFSHLMVSGYSGDAVDHVGDNTDTQILNATDNLLNTAVQEQPRLTAPEGPLFAIFESLRAQADAGDNEAAFQLVLGLEKCMRSRPSSQTQLDTALTELDQYGLYNGGYVGDSLEFKAHLKKRLVHTYEYCQGIGQSQLNVAKGYLEQATQAGLIQAQISYLHLKLNYQANIDHTPILTQFIDQLQQAANQGSADALAELFRMYQGQQSSLFDPFKATLFGKAYISALEHKLKADPKANYTNRLRTYKKMVDDLKPHLYEHQQDQAREQAAVYLKNACCIFLSADRGF